MTDLRSVLMDLYDQQSELAGLFAGIAGRHAEDVQLAEDCTGLSELADLQLAQLADLASGFGVHLDPRLDRPGSLEHIRQSAERLLGGAHHVKARLLEDVRQVYLTAAAALLNWRLLAAIGTERVDPELRDLAADCAVGMERQQTWAREAILARGPTLLEQVTTR